MTERGRTSLTRDTHSFQVGPSKLQWHEDDGAPYLTLEFDEVAVPLPPQHWLPKRIKGSLKLTPKAITDVVHDIDAHGHQRWWPIAPLADIEINLDHSVMGDTIPDWSGHGYLDSNWGIEPLEAGFDQWDWARGQVHTDDGEEALILYDTKRMDGSVNCLALRYNERGELTHFDAPPCTTLKRGFWGVARRGHHDEGAIARVVKTLEDGPFYTRNVMETQLLGKPVTLMHESLSGRRFASPIVKAMLPFRMPRRG